MKKYVIGTIGLCALFIGVGTVSADAWNLPGINIITRAQRGADESWRYSSRPEYQAMIANQAHTYVTAAQEEQQEEDAAKVKISHDFAIQNFPQDILVDKVISVEGTNSLRWPLEYNYEKTKIIVHHTADDMSKIKTESDMTALLQSVYRYHAFSNGWGDVGYNFIISPGGVIYEGRDGGEGVVGAHASWNNGPSVGIALIGNFNNDHPTDAQIASLVKLITALAQKYNIDPESKIDRHRKATAYPYVSTFSNYTVVGHRDVGPTECPGENLYKLLPAIRDSVEYNLQHTVNLVSSVTAGGTVATTANTTKPALPGGTGNQQAILTVPSVYDIPTETYLLHIRTANMGTTLPQCKLVAGDVTISGCMYRAGELIVGIKKHDNPNPGSIRITAKSRTSTLTFNVGLSRHVVSVVPTTNTVSGTMSTLLQERRKLFSLPAVSSLIKINLPTTASDAPTLMKKDIRVLLYNASMLSSSRTLTCAGGCTLSDSPFTAITVSYAGGMLNVQKNGLVRKESALTVVASSGSTIAVSDALTHQQYGIYRGKIDILNQQIKKIDGTFTSQYGLIDTLPLEQYLRGIAEASDSEPIEKTKVLALLTKAYALYYVGGSSAHPSIPKGVVYNAIDDPRFFQKYAGVTRENTSKNRPIALAATKDEYVVYNNILPILPYFHCSPGFTRSAREKWGWSDTPYLQSVVDDPTCADFEGHGVGLSGQGATKKAQQGMKAEDIITYYYPGVQLQTLK